MARQRKNPILSVEGFEEINKALNKLSDQAAGRLLQEAAEAGAEVIREEASRLAPRNTGVLSETMGKRDKRLQVGRAQIEVGISKKAWYGRLLEKGTKYIAARPFLRPAFDAKKEEAKNTVGRILRKALGL